MRSQWRIILALVGVLALLAACGEDTDVADEPDEEVADDDTDAAADEEVADDDAAEDDPEPADGEEITVWIMQPGSDDIESLLQDSTEAFESESGAVVDLQFVPWPDAHDQFTTAIAAGETPDVAEMGTTWTAEFGDLGVFLPQDAEIGDGDYIEAVVDSGTLEGQALGLPWYAGARALLYRSDVFDELGLEPPTTWDEFIEVGETIQAETDMHAFAASPSNHSFLPLVWQAGGEIAEEVAPGEWEARLDEPEAIEAFDYYAALLRDHEFAPAGALNWHAGDAREAFFNETVAMHIGLGVDVSISLDENPDLEGSIGVAPLPEGPAGNGDTFAGGSHLVTFAESDAPDTAQAYAEFLLEPERVSEFAQSVGFFPGTVDGIEAMDLDEHEEVLAEMMTDHSRTYPPHPAWGGFEGEDLFINAMQEIMSGDAEPADVLADVSERMNEQFAD